MQAMSPRREPGVIQRVIRACGWLGVSVGLLAGVITFLMVDYGYALMTCGYEPLSFAVDTGQWECVTKEGAIVPAPDLLWSVVSVLIAVVVWTGIGALLGRLMRDSEHLDLDRQGIG
jgi:hypothetical protein